MQVGIKAAPGPRWRARGTGARQEGRTLQNIMNPNISLCCLSLLLLLNFVGAKPVSELQVSLPVHVDRWWFDGAGRVTESLLVPAESEAAPGGGDQRCALLLLGGGGGGGRRRWKHGEVGVRSSGAAAVGPVRPQQLGTGGERKRPCASLQGPFKNLQALMEPAQEGGAEELLRGPVREDRLLQWAGMLKVGAGERTENES